MRDQPDWFRGGILVAVIGASLAVFNYYRAENKRLDEEVRQRDHEALEEAFTARARQQDLDTCLTEAFANYSDRWNESCSKRDRFSVVSQFELADTHSLGLLA